MKKRIKQGIAWGLPLILILAIGLLRGCPQWCEWYARECYPYIIGGLSAFSSLFPFSLGDCFIVAVCFGIVAYPFYAWKKKKAFWEIAGKMVRFLLWIYIWFYVAWGMNYFRLPFYERTGIERPRYSSQEFGQFLNDYITCLTVSYTTIGEDKAREWCINNYFQEDFWVTGSAEQEITAWYQNNSARLGFLKPEKVPEPKTMLWSKGMSMVGVTGYMGPFWGEFNLNRELLNVEYPFTYAHELAHRLGIAGEAEANLYAFLATTHSDIPEVNFSGYFSLLGYIMNNARRLLTEEEYRDIIGKIPPGVIDLYREHLLYWREKYQPFIGAAQNKLYNAYLKGNKIHNGTKNYSEVVGLLMAYTLHDNRKP